MHRSKKEVSFGQIIFKQTTSFQINGKFTKPEVLSILSEQKKFNLHIFMNMSFNCSIFNIYSYLQFILNISSGVDWDSGIPIDIRTFIISYIHLKIFMEIKLIKLNFFLFVERNMI